jgi:hypothetical protein
MDPVKTATENNAQAAAKQNGRRRRSEMTNENVRYFLPKAGASSDRPELGQEMKSEGEALVQAFRTLQVFYAVVTWKAVPEVDGDEPRIVKQALPRS